jgi:microcystin-dependent protein
LVPISQNQPLYALLGTIFGGDGETTLGIPDMRGRAAIGISGGHPIGQAGGEEAHDLSDAELPAHSHGARASPLHGTTASPFGAWLAAAAMYAPPNDLEPLAQGSVGYSGMGQPHDNMQPFLTVNVCICARGDFPQPPGAE